MFSRLQRRDAQRSMLKMRCGNQHGINVGRQKLAHIGKGLGRGKRGKLVFVPVAHRNQFHARDFALENIAGMHGTHIPHSNYAEADRLHKKGKNCAQFAPDSSRHLGLSAYGASRSIFQPPPVLSGNGNGHAADWVRPCQNSQLSGVTRNPPQNGGGGTCPSGCFFFKAASSFSNSLRVVMTLLCAETHAPSWLP